MSAYCGMSVGTSNAVEEMARLVYEYALIV